jgi:16S rRNA (uracil1498-N3)-methyltransferase
MATVPRVYIQQSLTVGATIVPDPTIERYLLNTLRLSVSATVHIFNGIAGGEWKATIVSQRPLQLRVVAYRELAVESPLQISVALCMCKSDALELALQKLTELGVQRLYILQCAHSASHGQHSLNENRLRRLHRVTIPEIQIIDSWPHFARSLQPGLKLLLKERGSDVFPLATALGSTPHVSLLIGPEGGFTKQELDNAIHSLQFIPVHLGPRILRCETAVLSAVTLCQALWGDFSGSRGD